MKTHSSVKLVVECLEDRCLLSYLVFDPSPVTIDNVSDEGVANNFQLQAEINGQSNPSFAGTQDQPNFWEQTATTEIREDLAPTPAESNLLATQFSNMAFFTSVTPLSGNALAVNDAEALGPGNQAPDTGAPPLVGQSLFISYDQSDGDPDRDTIHWLQFITPSYPIENAPGNVQFAAGDLNIDNLGSRVTPFYDVENIANEFGFVDVPSALLADVPNSPNPTGTVDFFDLATQTDLGSAPLGMVGGTDQAILSVPGLAVGDHSIVLTYSGDQNYGQETATVGEDVGPGAPTLTVTDASGPYTGSPFTATALVAGTVTGVDDTPAASLEGVTPTLTYYSGTDTTGTPLSGAPTNPGTYTVVASFAGSADYASASAQVTFQINPTITSVVVNENLSALYASTGGPQMSMVDDIVYTFSAPVNITDPTTDPNVFTVAVASGWTGTVPGVTWAPVAGSNNTQWAVSFTDVIGGSIANGAYTITVSDPTAITASADGQQLSLASSGIGGATQSFYRLFGDINGDEFVNATDNAQFQAALTAYNAAFDYNDDGSVNAYDNHQFSLDLTVNFNGFTATI